MKSRIKIRTTGSSSTLRKQSTFLKEQDTMRKSDIESVGILPEFEQN
jgi:hypothetical protein